MAHIIRSHQSPDIATSELHKNSQKMLYMIPHIHRNIITQDEDIYFEKVSEIFFGILSYKAYPIRSLRVQSGANAVNMRSAMICAVKAIGEVRNTNSLAAGIEPIERMIP